MTMMMKLVPVFAIAALLFAVYLAMKVSRQEAGTKKMRRFPTRFRKEPGRF